MTESKSFDFDKVKQQISIFIGVVQRKLTYFIECINRFGFNGVLWWLQTQSQIDEFEAALENLRAEFSSDNINLLSMEQLFSNFIVPEEDLGHIYWYTDAHNKLGVFEKKLDEKKLVDVKLLQLAMKELKFIGQSDEFHHHYRLEKIQQRIKDMYQELQQKIVEQQSLERESIDAEKQKHVAEIARAEADKAASITKEKMMETVKTKEKRLAIIEEKKRLLAEKEATEAKIIEQNNQVEMNAKAAEIDRQVQLQESYQALEIKEKMKELPLEELIEMVNKQIENKKILTFIQLDQLSKLKQTIEEKKG